MGYDDMAPHGVLPTAAKWLHADGSVTDWDGNIIVPANAAGAADFESRSPSAAKWLLPDGSITTEIPSHGGSGDNSGSGGGGDNSGDGDESDPEQVHEIYVPIIATDGLGEVFLSGHIPAPVWRDDITEIENTVVAEVSATAVVS